MPRGLMTMSGPYALRYDMGHVAVKPDLPGFQAGLKKARHTGISCRGGANDD